MPEGDTLWRMAAALRERIQGEICREIRPASFRRLAGRQVTDVEARGKHLFIWFDSGLGLHSHLRMRGAWYVLRPGESLPAAKHEIKSVLTFDQWLAVLVSAPVVEIVAGHERVEHLGPDILAQPLDLDNIFRGARSNPDRAIGEVLLDQSVCAGIGNIWKCETLWHNRVSPLASVSQITDDQLKRIYETASRLMRASAGGAIGRPRHAVHGRGGKPCPRCHRLIRVRNQGQPPRLTYWCPACQGRDHA